MNKSLPIVLLFLTVNFLYAQNSQWSNIVNLSDSLHDNQNFDVVKVQYETSLWHFEDSVFIAWEQVIDDSTTQIVLKNIQSQSSAFPILSQPGIKFTKPKFMPMGEFTSGIESVFYLFYQSNQNGNSDIYYLKYFVDKTFSQPIPFAVSSANEKDLNTGSMSVVWQSTDTLFISSLDFNFNWTPKEIIDFGNCRTPMIYEYIFIFWLKSVNDSSKIYFKEWDFQNGQWSSDSLLFGEGSSSNISVGGTSGGLPFLTWENIGDTVSQIYFCDLILNKEIFRLDKFLDLNKHDPSNYVTQVPIGDRSNNYPLAAFVLDTLGFNQIYANDYFMYSNNFVNVSMNSTTNRNPNLFEGEWDGYYLKVYLIWECFQNGHWQLQMRTISFDISSIDDRQDNFISNFELFQNYPNPFNSSTIIEYRLPHSIKVELKIYDILGREVNTLVNKQQTTGNHQIEWDGKDKEGNYVSSGLYLYYLKTRYFFKSKKLLLIK